MHPRGIDLKSAIFAVGREEASFSFALLSAQTGMALEERSSLSEEKLYRFWQQANRSYPLLTVADKPHTNGIFRLFYRLVGTEDTNSDHPWPFYHLAAAERFAGLKSSSTPRQEGASNACWVAARFRGCLIAAHLIEPIEKVSLALSWRPFPDNVSLFSVDCESVGFYGETFAAAYAVYRIASRSFTERGVFFCPHETLKGSEEAKRWVRENVKLPWRGAVKLDSPREVKSRIWKTYKRFRKKCAPLLLVAKNWYPVEFGCFSGRPVGAVFEASTIQLVAQISSSEVERDPSELHNPLSDAEHASRIVEKAIRKRGLISF